MNKLYPALFILGLTLTQLSCGSSSSSSSSTNGLSDSYPSDMVLASPFADGNAVESLLRLGSRAQAQGDMVEIQGFAEKRQEVADRLIATDINSCSFLLNLSANAPTANCYGPPIDYTNHTDGTGGDGSLPSGDLGIWEETEGDTNEACVARKINSLVGEVQARVDGAIALMTAMLCIANVNGSDTLPGVGEPRDLASEVDSGLSDFTVSAASVERSQDTTAGNPTYVSRIVGEEVLATQDATPTALDVTLTHVRGNTTNTEYQGRMQSKITGDFDSGGNCPSGTKMLATSILYEKTGNSLRYRMMNGAYCSTTADPFDENGDLDGSSKFNQDSNPSGWANNFSDATFNINTSDGSGNYSYAWQAGPMDGRTRTFVANIFAEETAGIQGCGYYGFGPDMSATNVGVIEGMICNWAGPGGRTATNDTSIQAEIVQRQCVAYDETAGIFTSDAGTLAISYAPSTTCSTSDGSFTFDDRSGPLTNDLMTLANYQSDVTNPTRPSDL